MDKFKEQFRKTKALRSTQNKQENKNLSINKQSTKELVLVEVRAQNSPVYKGRTPQKHFIDSLSTQRPITQSDIRCSLSQNEKREGPEKQKGADDQNLQQQSQQLPFEAQKQAYNYQLSLQQSGQNKVQKASGITSQAMSQQGIQIYNKQCNTSQSGKWANLVHSKQKVLTLNLLEQSQELPKGFFDLSADHPKARGEKLLEEMEKAEAFDQFMIEMQDEQIAIEQRQTQQLEVEKLDNDLQEDFIQRAQMAFLVSISQSGDSNQKDNIKRKLATDQQVYLQMKKVKRNAPRTLFQDNQQELNQCQQGAFMLQQQKQIKEMTLQSDSDDNESVDNEWRSKRLK